MSSRRIARTGTLRLRRWVPLGMAYGFVVYFRVLFVSFRQLQLAEYARLQPLFLLEEVGPRRSNAAQLPKLLMYEEDRLKSMEQQIQSTFGSKVVSCRREEAIAYKGNSAQNRGDLACANSTLILYNPSARDKFLCNGEIVVGPKKHLQLDDTLLRKCVGPEPTYANFNGILIRKTLLAHSHPRPPTFENRNTFPGIITQHAIHTDEDIYSTTVIAEKTKAFATKCPCNGRVACDVKCIVEKAKGLQEKRRIYGTNWEVTRSMEGEKYYPNLKVPEGAWKNGKFYATTSRKSVAPLSYLGFQKSLGWTYDSRVPFSTAIKGASFLAKNCGSKNNREAWVKGLIKSGFRVDSLSSCLRNTKPPNGVNLKNKTQVMRQYLFHLAFENQDTDDYITEKLWGTIRAGTIPVYLGAANIYQHIPREANMIIHAKDFPTVEALAEHLAAVSNNETLYESYQSWRRKELHPAFVNKYQPYLGYLAVADDAWTSWIESVYNSGTTQHRRPLYDRFEGWRNESLPVLIGGHDQCRICRWAHAKKYGIGWDHAKQVLRRNVLSREACVGGRHNTLLMNPALESWRVVEDAKFAAGGTQMTGNGRNVQDCSPLRGAATSGLGSDLTRTVWSNDGTTDIFIEGNPAKSYELQLAFSMTNHGPMKVVDAHTVWIQDDASRISIVVHDFDGTTLSNVTANEGSFAIAVRPEALPIRVRIIIEDQDLFHKGGNEVVSHYGKVMAEDVFLRPEIFAMVNEQ